MLHVACFWTLSTIRHAKIIVGSFGALFSGLVHNSKTYLKVKWTEIWGLVGLWVMHFCFHMYFKHVKITGKVVFIVGGI